MLSFGIYSYRDQMSGNFGRSSAARTMFVLRFVLGYLSVIFGGSGYLHISRIFK